MRATETTRLAAPVVRVAVVTEAKAQAVVAALVVLWEIYKVGKALDGTWPFTDAMLPVRPDNRTLPHSWDIVWALFQPVRRGGELLIEWPANDAHVLMTGPAAEVFTGTIPREGD